PVTSSQRPGNLSSRGRALGTCERGVIAQPLVGFGAYASTTFLPNPLNSFRQTLLSDFPSPRRLQAVCRTSQSSRRLHHASPRSLWPGPLTSSHAPPQAQVAPAHRQRLAGSGNLRPEDATRSLARG